MFTKLLSLEAFHICNFDFSEVFYVLYLIITYFVGFCLFTGLVSYCKIEFEKENKTFYGLWRSSMDVFYSIIFIWMKGINSSLSHVAVYILYLNDPKTKSKSKTQICSRDFDGEIHWSVGNTILAQSSLWGKYLVKVHNKDSRTNFTDFALISVLLNLGR